MKMQLIYIIFGWISFLWKFSWTWSLHKGGKFYACVIRDLQSQYDLWRTLAVFSGCHVWRGFLRLWHSLRLIFRIAAWWFWKKYLRHKLLVLWLLFAWNERIVIVEQSRNLPFLWFFWPTTSCICKTSIFLTVFDRVF